MSLDHPTKKWTDFAADELESHYNPRATGVDVESYDKARAELNQAGLAWPGRVADIAYGEGNLMDLDIYKPAQGAGPHPVHVYIHGGYWRARQKENFGFIGASLAGRGLLTVVINYPLCPVVTLDAVVAGARDAFGWVVQNIAEHDGDPDRITVSGHSAGGHLGDAIMAEDWAARGLTGNLLKGAVLISGVYDPTPTQHLRVNEEIGITAELAARHNYAAHQPVLNCPTHVIVGGAEPEGWIAQSADYARHIRDAGLDVTYKISDGENHFSLQDQYHTEGSDVLQAISHVAGV
ncbi:MAG: alpha/beta hydrolase [Pseudomonadota bacterium]